MKNLLLPFFLTFILNAQAQTSSYLVIAKIADSLYEIGEYNKAIPYFRKIGNYQKIANSYEALGNYSDARKYSEKALSGDESNPKTQYDYAKFLVRLSNYKIADSILEILQNKFPSNSNFVYERGLIKEVQKDSTAIDLFLQAHQMDSNNLNAIYKIARNYIKNRKFKEAEPFIERGLSVDKNSSRFLTLLAIKDFYTEKFHEAISTYTILISKGESYPSLHENLARSYSQTNQFEKALEQYKILLQKFDDKNPKYHHEVGVLYRSMQEYEKAERHFNIAIGLLETPLSNEYYELSKLYGWNKNSKNEMYALRKAIANNPNNEQAYYHLAVAADNYFKDKKTVLGYYENYLKKYGETGRMRNLVKQRISDLKMELHFISE
ncbi:tetratricopeptide repeat protein [Aequorivita sp. H23M31]|uniref:Tetratricopeptide repeat protein n=1 Tax=Aequorivita ciconiae TaxID=2494375 RepID=A0A410G5Q0_9FLAO|nr:tetratricopeptide repeat protein [Aequorivita sp. H23M31]QAA82618.1 tetratricopeptide repeat protein [Aequorivita sp. H23M31]